MIRESLSVRRPARVITGAMKVAGVAAGLWTGPMLAAPAEAALSLIEVGLVTGGLRYAFVLRGNVRKGFARLRRLVANGG